VARRDHLALLHAVEARPRPRERILGVQAIDDLLDAQPFVRSTGAGAGASTSRRCASALRIAR
jgi:hypothetical protein